MRLRTPVAAVVGALLLGGAATGTTLALWRSGTTVDDGALMPGKIGLVAVGSPAAISKLGLNNADAGEPQVFAETLTNTGKGKNLRMRVYLDTVTSTSETLNTGLELSIASSPTSTCPQPSAFSDYQPLRSFRGIDLTDTALAPNQSRTMCGAVRVMANADGTMASQGGQLAFQFHGQQVRPSGEVATWTATASNMIWVSTAAPALKAPTVTCSGSGTNPTLKWSTVPGAAFYNVYRVLATGLTLRKKVDAPSTSLSLSETDMGMPVEQSQKYDVLVKAATTASEGPASNTFAIQFKKNGQCS